jgi:hypothetical protein
MLAAQVSTPSGDNTMTMTTDQLELTRKLLGATQVRQLRWEPTAEEDLFQASVGGYVVLIGPRFSARLSTDRTALVLLDADGSVVDEFGVEDASDQKAIETLEELHSSARRQARGAQHAIQSILQELGKAAV